jgi:hypothetical protein
LRLPCVLRIAWPVAAHSQRHSRTGSRRPAAFASSPPEGPTRNIRKQRGPAAFSHPTRGADLFFALHSSPWAPTSYRDVADPDLSPLSLSPRFSLTGMESSPPHPHDSDTSLSLTHTGMESSPLDPDPSPTDSDRLRPGRLRPTRSERPPEPGQPGRGPARGLGSERATPALPSCRRRRWWAPIR